MARYDVLLIGSAVVAAVVFISLQFIAAPYGRHTRGGWGPQISSRLGWIVMEGVAVFAIAFFCFRERPEMTPALWILLGLWELHYVNRAFIYPLRMRTRGKTNPISVVVMAMAYNTWNGYLNGHWLGTHAHAYGQDWLSRPAVIAGILVFFAGMAINIWSDEILLQLRKTPDGGYSIPRGGLYRWVSCPNYLGELIEWTGWAMMAWSPEGLVVVVGPATNLGPRARSDHKWYQEKFGDYRADRKAIVPFVY